MKTLHYDASGNYTGYSVNHSSWSEKAVGAALALGAAAVTTAICFMVGNVVMPTIMEKYTQKQQQKQLAAQQSDEFEDPK